MERLSYVDFRKKGMYLMKKNKKSLCLGLAFSMTVALCMPVGALGTTAVEAKKTTKKDKAKVVLNKKKVTIALKDDAANTFKLKVKKAPKKVAWKTSNKKIAIIKKVTGKKKQNVVIQAKKEGKCTITAKVGAKKLKCEVIVKTPSSSVPEEQSQVVTKGAVGVYVTSATATGKSISVTVNFYNGSQKEAGFGLDFSIDKWVNGQWVRVESAKDILIPSIACIIKPQGEGAQTFKMEEAKENFATGKYRINTSLSATENAALVNQSAEFWLTVN